MSRALTVFSRRDAQNDYNSSEIEDIMAEQGCSEPVARNLIKYAKFGVGPLAQRSGSTSDRDGARPRDRAPARAPPPDIARDLPPKPDPKAMAALMEQRMREQEEQEELDLEAKRRAGQAKKKKGFTSLGPVLTRKQEVDPFLAVEGFPQPGAEAPQPASPPPPLPAGAFESNDKKTDVERDAPRPPEDDNHHRRRERPREHLQDDETHRKADRRKRRRGRDGDGESDGSDRDFKDRGGGRDVRRVFTEKGSRHEKMRSISPASEPAPQDKPAPSRPGGIMTEAEVRAMMGKEKKFKRGSVQAQARIQKEQQEWEQRKASDPEFWKAPQFALCFDAERSKRR